MVLCFTGNFALFSLRFPAHPFIFLSLVLILSRWVRKKKNLLLYKPSVIKWTIYLVFCCSSYQSGFSLDKVSGKWSNWDWEVNLRVVYLLSPALVTFFFFMTWNVVFLKSYWRIVPEEIKMTDSQVFELWKVSEEGSNSILPAVNLQQKG